MRSPRVNSARAPRAVLLGQDGVLVRARPAPSRAVPEACLLETLDHHPGEED